MLEVGAIVEGKVTGITKFGAFVEISGGKTGMVHISEISNSYVRDINEHLKLGDAVRVYILGTDDSGRINLSIRRALPPQETQTAPARRDPPATFDDMLSRFLKESEERQLDYKRATGRKGGGYSRSRG